MRLDTKNIHVGIKTSDPSYGSVAPPIYPTSTYIFPSAAVGAKRFAGKERGMIYSRFTNPTVEALQERLAALEDAQAALATTSGMSAIITTLMHLLRSGDHVIAHTAVYGGTYEFLQNIAPRFNIKVDFVNFEDLSNIKKKINKKTKIIYFESPTNPLLEVLDIEKICELAKSKKILTVFDNTFAPPPMQYPLKLGIDIVVHSLTKYIGGHSDLIGGAIIGSKKMIDDIFFKTYIFMGPTISPFTSFLAMRGMNTLGIRLKKHSENAQQVAEFLEAHPKVSKVYYPGLISHPYHELAKKQMTQFGGVLAFEVKGGYKAGEKLVNSVKLIDLAVSLGAVESLIEHPASMTHSELSPADRKKANIKESLIRLSVGLENIEDIVADLKQALGKI